MKVSLLINRLRVLILLLWSQLICVPLHASEVVGKVTAVNYATGIVAINNISYRLDPGAGSSSATAAEPISDVRSLRYGQIVTFVAENGVIKRISILPAAKEMPR